MRIVLLADEGHNNKQISGRLSLSQATVGKWRKRFVQQGVQGPHDEVRSGLWYKGGALPKPSCRIGPTAVVP